MNRIAQDPHNETLWEKYLSLIDGEDIRRAMEPEIEHLESQRAMAVQGLEIAREINRRKGALNRFEESRKVLFQKIKQDPHNEDLWLQYISLLDGEDARDGITPEGRQSMKSSASKDLEVAREMNRRKLKYKGAFNRFEESCKASLRKIKLDHHNEDLWLEHLSLLDGEDARFGSS